MCPQRLLMNTQGGEKGRNSGACATGDKAAAAGVREKNIPTEKSRCGRPTSRRGPTFHLRAAATWAAIQTAAPGDLCRRHVGLRPQEPDRDHPLPTSFIGRACWSRARHRRRALLSMPVSVDRSARLQWKSFEVRVQRAASCAALTLITSTPFSAVEHSENVPRRRVAHD